MPRVSSADVPRYDTYPAPTPAESEGMPQDWPYEPLTDEARAAHNQRLDQTAEQIGETLGRVVAIARTARERLQQARNQSGELKENVAGMARERLEDWRGAAGERIEELRQTATERVEELRARTQQTVGEARERAVRRINEA